MVGDVSTIASLRAMPSPAERTTVFVQGYDVSGDGGGGLFTFVRHHPGTPPHDNHGTIVAPNDAPNGEGRWQRQFSGWLDARWFGARGDGTHDDQPAIQRAVDAADGATVYLPAGTYRLETTIVRWASKASPDGKTITRPGMRIVGENKDRTKLVVATSGKAALAWDADGADQQHYNNSYTIDSLVQDLTITIDPDTNPQNAYGIWLVAAWCVRLKNVQVIGMTGSGLICPRRGTQLSDHYQCAQLEIDQCIFKNCHRFGIELGAGQSPAGLSIHTSWIQANGLGGIYLTTGQCEIVNNVIGENQHAGLRIDTSEGPSMVAFISHNEFDRNDNMHLWVRHAQSIRVTQNRFLSAVPKNKTEMVPKIQVGLGDADDPHLLSYNGVFEQNYHRSTDDNKPQASARVYGYFIWKAVDDLQKDNAFRDNQFSASVNSTDLVKVHHQP